MTGYIERALSKRIRSRLKAVPAVALLGPRQCGKSTLAKVLMETLGQVVYLDLERPSDLNKLVAPEVFFDANRESLICLDEVQRVPELFSILRSVIDDRDRNGQFLILGSASRDLIRQSSESLAGRISYIELTPFRIDEVPSDHSDDLRRFWQRGGFPRSLLAGSEEDSFEWREDFIRTFLERDLPALGFRISSQRMDRLWRMVAHVHGNLLNASKLADSLGVSYHTVRAYFELLEQLFVLRLLPPIESNLKKKLVKSPKIFIRDSGLLHTLLDIRDHNSLLGHPICGASFEGLVIENLLTIFRKWRGGFYRSRGGAEIDLILEKGNKRIAVECKLSKSPRVSRGFRSSIKEMGIKQAFVVAPVNDSYPVGDGITVTNMKELIATVKP